MGENSTHFSDDRNGLPRGWTIVSLGEFLGGRGETVDPSKHRDELFELYSIPSFDTKSPEIVEGRTIGSAKQSVVPGTVLISKINPRINRSWQVGARRDLRQIASTEWICFPPHQAIEPEYLRYFMTRDAFRSFLATNVSGVGGSLMRVRSATLAPYSLPIAPIREQRRIVEKIDELLSDIEAGERALERARKRLDRYRQAVLKAAVTGELTKNWREKHKGEIESGEALLTRILKARRAAWEQAELAKMRAKGQEPKDERWKQKYRIPTPPDVANLPPLPDGWVWAALDQLAWESSYGTSERCSETATGPLVLRIPNVRSAALVLDDLKYAHSTLELTEVEGIASGDMLIIRTNGSLELLGHAVVIERPMPAPTYFASYLIRFRLVATPALWRWVMLAWRSHKVRDTIIRDAATSAGQYNVSQSKLQRVALPIPPLSELEQATDRGEELLAAAAGNLHEIEDACLRANALRQSVLTAAFSGKLVPQDPSDEPAAALLDRIRSQRAAGEGPRNRKRVSRTPRSERSEVAVAGTSA